jgi:tetratricopeptide (TPR) repeat protein
LPEIDLVRAHFALWNREPEALLGYLEAMPDQAFETQIVYFPKPLYAAWAHRLRGDEPAARAAFDSARVSLERLVRENPEDGRFTTSLGYAYAGLGRSQDAADAAERSMQFAQRAGLELSEAAARILAQANLPDLAIPYLEAVLQADSPISAQTLRLDPLLDPIRDHPAFQALIERYTSRN